MTNPILTETLRNERGWPCHTITLSIPDYWKDKEKPGAVEWTIYEVAGVEEGGGLLYHRARANSSGDTVTDLDEAESTARGGVKWDGCANYEVGIDGVMLHACGPEDVDALCTALQRAYALAAVRVGVAGS